MLGTRNTPTAMYLATSPGPGMSEKDGKVVPSGGFFWDGRAATLADQALGPLFSAHEMNNRDMAALVAKVAASDAAPLLRQVYGVEVFASTERAGQAITGALAAFEQSPTLSPFTSKFDAALRGQARLTEQEERGRSLFVIAQKGNCASCHTVESGQPRSARFAVHGLQLPRARGASQCRHRAAGSNGSRPLRHAAGRHRGPITLVRMVQDADAAQRCADRAVHAQRPLRDAARSRRVLRHA